MEEVRNQVSDSAEAVENAAPEQQAATEAPGEAVTAQPAAAADIATGKVEAPAADASADNAGDAARPDAGGAGLDVILHIPVTVQVVLGRAKMPISRLMSLGPGAVVPLDRKAGEPVEVVVNGRLVARGEVVLLDDGVRFGISLTEIVEPGARTC